MKRKSLCSAYIENFKKIKYLCQSPASETKIEEIGVKGVIGVYPYSVGYNTQNFGSNTKILEAKGSNTQSLHQAILNQYSIIAK